uniref:Uncharacterized protein n=1 Tax=Tetraselmis sp. GSL018 TaxID=582737 RepID=A0A061R1W6_9CHLO
MGSNTRFRDKALSLKRPVTKAAAQLGRALACSPAFPLEAEICSMLSL